MALYPECTGLVNLRVMAEEICGHFVTVKKSKVTLAHETALEFLLKNSTNLPLPISERQGHTHAASVCMTFLSDSMKWRRIFNSVQPSQQSQRTESEKLIFEQNPFLSYALSQWAYHVSRATLECEEFLGNVLEFLEEYCLLWMHGVALTGRLRTLIRSAQYLKTFAKKRGQLNSKWPPRGLAVGREEDMRQWANDMTRIVGRFGSNMLENPACISTLVVPFCPRDSITAKTFGLSLQGGPIVQGVSSSEWDDCLARLNLGDNRLAAQVLCKDKYLITLLAKGGIVGLWHSETFEELRKIKHGDYVTNMAISWTSNIISTAGFNSTKVWDMTNGKLLNTLPNGQHHRPKTVSFGVDDDEVWIAYDDCEIKCFNLETNEEKKGFLARDPASQNLSCARWLRFNRANTQVAIVFRGRPVLVWNIQELFDKPPVPRRCVLADDRLRSAIEGDAWNSPERCFWHPTQPDRLFILYEDTKIVEWDVVNDEQTVYDHTLARTMTISKDGNVLLTSDKDGTLSIWALPGCSPVCRARYDGLVTDLSFSPDGTRFYDLRGSFCNAWEPDALIRADNLDRDDLSSTLDATMTSEAVEANDDSSRVPVTALVCDSSDRYYCVGKEDGSVTIHNIADGTRSRKVVSHATSCSVIKLAWSASDKYLASVDDSGRIIVKRLEPPGTATGNGSGKRGKWAVFPVLDIRMEDDAVVRQVLFGNRDSSLLTTSASRVGLFSLRQRREVCRKETDSEGRAWFNHPRDPALVVRLGAHTHQQYFWKDLSPVHGHGAEPSTELADDTPQVPPRVIQQKVQVRDQWVLVELKASSPDDNTAELYPPPQRNAREFELLNLHKLPGNSSATRVASSQSAAATSMRQTLQGLAPHVKQLVGCFQDRVVFLDHRYWLCTWELALAYSKHKRHFFLPKDWVSPAALQMLALNKKGVLLCPRNGEVAIVRSGFRYVNKAKKVLALWREPPKGEGCSASTWRELNSEWLPIMNLGVSKFDVDNYVMLNQSHHEVLQ